MAGRGGSRGRFSARREVAIGLGLYGVYLLVRHAALRAGGEKRAHENADRIVAIERRLHIHVEPHIQQLVLPKRRLVAVMNIAYATLNVGLTVAWLLRLFSRHDPQYHHYRRASVVAFLGAQPLFLLLPTAPPRKLDHLVDTIAEVSGVDLDSGIVAKLYHPLAAMPSIHVTIAVVTAEGIRQTTRSALVRRVAPGYPFVVAGVVLATANHYALDVVAGYALGKLALRLTRALDGRR
jgi:hypothetical protein